jgi:hypothetical protein
MAQAEGMIHVLCGCLFGMASNPIDSFDPFNIFELIDFPLTPRFSLTCVSTTFGTALAFETDAMLRTKL